MTPRPPQKRPSQGAAGRRRLTAIVALLVPLAAAAAVVLSGGGGTARPSHSRRVHARVAPHAATTPHHPPRKRHTPARITGVAQLTLTLAEPSTASIATGHSSSGQPVRVLPTRVRYPIVSGGTGHARFPLVVFSEGFNEPAEAYSGLLNAWAHAGYVVASPTYPLTDPTQPGGVNESDIVNHPADLRYVIAALRAAAGNSHSQLHSVLNPHLVAITGQSDGGDVSLAVAADTCCRDPAVRAAMILSGAELAAFGGTYYSQGNVPLLVVQGSNDTINVPGCSAQLYDQAQPPKYYLDIIGAPHLPPYVDPGPIRRGIEVATIAFLNAILKHRPAALGRARSQLPAGETLTSGGTAPGPPSEVCPGAP